MPELDWSTVLIALLRFGLLILLLSDVPSVLLWTGLRFGSGGSNSEPLGPIDPNVRCKLGTTTAVPGRLVAERGEAGVATALLLRAVVDPPA